MKCKKCCKEIPDGSVFCCFCGARQQAQKGRRTRANGTGCAFKRGKTWTAIVTAGYKSTEDEKAKRVTRSKGGFATKKEAMA